MDICRRSRAQIPRVPTEYFWYMVTPLVIDIVRPYNLLLSSREKSPNLRSVPCFSRLSTMFSASVFSTCLTTPKLAPKVEFTANSAEIDPTFNKYYRSIQHSHENLIEFDNISATGPVVCNLFPDLSASKMRDRNWLAFSKQFLLLFWPLFTE